MPTIMASCLQIRLAITILVLGAFDAIYLCTCISFSVLVALAHLDETLFVPICTIKVFGFFPKIGVTCSLKSSIVDPGKAHILTFAF